MEYFVHFLCLEALFHFLPITAFSQSNNTAECDAYCLLSYQQALTSESLQWVNLNITEDPFYSNPANLSAYMVGDIIRWEDLPRDSLSSNWTLPAGTSLSRFLYMSEDIAGRPIPASAFVILPYSNPLGATEPLRTVVWAHGTAGGTRQCAPSNNKVLYYEWEGPFALVQQGYAVIAPDYAGQGSDIPQGFMYESGSLHAADVSFAIIAARKALKSRITYEWVVVGHSEGGMSAWRTDEREAKPGKATGGFLGAVAAAPALRPLSLIPESFRRAGKGPVGDVVSIYVLQSISRLYPSIRLTDYVTDIVANRIPLADKGCLTTGATIYGNLTLDQLYRNTSWLEHPDVVDWQKRYNGAGPHKLAGPMLIPQGLNDTLTYATLTEYDFNQTCDAFPDTAAHLLLYPELDHDPAFQAAQADYLPWIKNRFEKLPVTACNKSTVVPATARFSKTQLYWNGQVEKI